MYETHHLATSIAAVFMFVVLGVSFMSEASLYEQQTEPGAVSVIPRTSPTHSNPVGYTNSAAVIVHEPEALVAGAEVLSTQVVADVPSSATAIIEPIVVETVVPSQPTSVTPILPPARSVSSIATQKNFAAAVATAVHEATNAARAESGLSPLSYDAALAANAAGYSKVLLNSGVLSHTDPSGCSMTCRFNASGYVAKAWGENLAVWESSYAPTVDEVVRYFISAWEKSDGHRDNLLSTNFTHEGVGVAREGNTIYVTVHFAKP